MPCNLPASSSGSWYPRADDENPHHRGGAPGRIAGDLPRRPAGQPPWVLPRRMLDRVQCAADRAARRRRARRRVPAFLRGVRRVQESRLHLSTGGGVQSDRAVEPRRAAAVGVARLAGVRRDRLAGVARVALARRRGGIVPPRGLHADDFRDQQAGVRGHGLSARDRAVPAGRVARVAARALDRARRRGHHGDAAAADVRVLDRTPVRAAAARGVDRRLLHARAAAAAHGHRHGVRASRHRSDRRIQQHARRRDDVAFQLAERHRRVAADRVADVLRAALRRQRFAAANGARRRPEYSPSRAGERRQHPARHVRARRGWRFVLAGTALSLVPVSLTVDRWHTLRMAPYPVFLVVLSIPALEWLRQRRRAAMAIAMAGAIQAVWFFTIFCRDGGKRWGEFDHGGRHAVDTAIAQGIRPIAVDDSVHIQAWWYGAQRGVEPSAFAIGVLPKPGGVVISAHGAPKDAKILLDAEGYTVYIARW